MPKKGMPYIHSNEKTPFAPKKKIRGKGKIGEKRATRIKKKIHREKPFKVAGAL